MARREGRPDERAPRCSGERSPGSPSGYRNILVEVQDPESGAFALRHASRLACPDGARITALASVQDQMWQLMPVLFPNPFAPIMSVRRMIAKSPNECDAKAASVLAAAVLSALIDFHVYCMTWNGPLDRALAERARCADHDLVVLAPATLGHRLRQRRLARRLRRSLNVRVVVAPNPHAGPRQASYTGVVSKHGVSRITPETSTAS
jgi:nucleotide-binding universal stress UspA family protein